MFADIFVGFFHKSGMFFDINSTCSLSQMLHGAGIFTYIYPKNHPHVGK